MAIWDNLSSFNADVIGTMFQLILRILLYIGFGALAMWGIWFLIKWVMVGRKNKVMVFELKDGKTVFLGEDRLSKKRMGGVDMAIFKKFNRDESFKDVKWPDSDAVLDMGKDKSLLHCILLNSQVVFTSMKYSPNPGFNLNPMPVDQKMDFMQTREVHERRFGEGGWMKANWPILALGAVILANIIVAFFQYQTIQSQQVAIAASYNNLASAMVQAAESFGGAAAIPPAP